MSACAFRPRFAEPIPANSPASCCRRQVRRLEEYNPSRRSKAPNSPGFVHRSASRTTRRLYAALNRLRIALLVTSGSGLSPF